MLRDHLYVYISLPIIDIKSIFLSAFRRFRNERLVHNSLHGNKKKFSLYYTFIVFMNKVSMFFHATGKMFILQLNAYVVYFHMFYYLSSG